MAEFDKNRFLWRSFAMLALTGRNVNSAPTEVHFNKILTKVN